MGLDLKICLLLFLCGWVASSEGTKVLGPYVKIDPSAVEHTAKKTITESNILEELAEAATKDQAGTKAIKGIKGLRVEDIRPPKIEMKCLPGKGILINLITQITIAGKSFIGGTMQITVVSNMKTECTLKEHLVKNISLDVTNCMVDLISCKTNLPTSMLPKIVNRFLNSTLMKVLPGMMCPAAKKVVGHMEEKMSVVFEQYPVGKKGKCRYATNGAPEIGEDYIGMPFRVIIEDKDGNEIEVPTDSAVSEDVPPKKEGSTEVIVPVNVLNALMKLFEEDISCDVSNAMAPSLTTDKLAEMIPPLAGVLPPSKNVKAEIRPKGSPTFSLGEEESTLDIPSTVTFSTDPENEQLLVLDMVQKWDCDFSVDDEKLFVSFESGEGRTTDIAVTSPPADHFDDEQLKGYMRDYVSTSCMPAVKSTLSENRMNLPNMLGAKYADSETKIHRIPKALILDVKTQAPDDSALMEKLQKFSKTKIKV